MKKATVVGKDIHGNDYYLIHYGGRDRWVTYRSRCPQGIYRIDFYIADNNAVPLDANELMSCVADTPEEALKTLGYEVVNPSSATVAVARSSVKTAYYMGPDVFGNDIYCLNDACKTFYVLAKLTKINGNDMIEFVKSCKDGSYPNDTLWTSHKPTIIEALQQWGYQISEQLGIPSHILEDKETVEDNWEERAKKKQDEIWKHMCR